MSSIETQNVIHIIVNVTFIVFTIEYFSLGIVLLFLFITRRTDLLNHHIILLKMFFKKCTWFKVIDLNLELTGSTIFL